VPKSVPGFATAPASEGRVETGQMGINALRTVSTAGETRRGLQVSPAVFHYDPGHLAEAFSGFPAFDSL
jgi:hypothetical protein